jgi:hypothetical protein
MIVSIKSDCTSGASISERSASVVDWGGARKFDDDDDEQPTGVHAEGDMRRLCTLTKLECSDDGDRVSDRSCGRRGELDTDVGNPTIAVGATGGDVDEG